MATKKKNPYGLPTPPLGGGAYVPPTSLVLGHAVSSYVPKPTPSANPFPNYNPNPAPAGANPTDYKNNILNDPLYKQALANLSAGGIQSAADRKAATDRALIQFGEIPDFTNSISGLGLDPNSSMFKFLSQDVDPATRASAAGLTKAGLSTTAKLATGHTTALDQLMSLLASRGIVRSGSTGVGTSLENQNYLSAQYTARNQLLDYLSGVQAAFAQSEKERRQAEAQAASDAAARQSQENPDTGGGGDGVQYLVGGPTGGESNGVTLNPSGYGNFPSLSPSQLPRHVGV